MSPSDSDFAQFREQTMTRLDHQEQRNDAKFELLLKEVKLNDALLRADLQKTFDSIDKAMHLMEKDMGWLKLILGAIVLPMLIAVLAFLFTK